MKSKVTVSELSAISSPAQSLALNVTEIELVPTLSRSVEYSLIVKTCVTVSKERNGMASTDV